VNGSEVEEQQRRSRKHGYVSVNTSYSLYRTVWHSGNAAFWKCCYALDGLLMTMACDAWQAKQ
jgi:hypothetical protein